MKRFFLKTQAQEGKPSREFLVFVEQMSEAIPKFRKSAPEDVRGATLVDWREDADQSTEKDKR